MHFTHLRSSYEPDSIMRGHCVEALPVLCIPVHITCIHMCYAYVSLYFSTAGGTSYKLHNMRMVMLGF